MRTPTFQGMLTLPIYTAWQSKHLPVVDTHHILVPLVVESLTKNSHDKEVDKKGDEERQAGFSQEIHVGLLHCLLLGPVDVPCLGTVGDMGATGSGEHPCPGWGCPGRARTSWSPPSVP